MDISMITSASVLAGLFIVALAFVAEYVDSTLGMGYGTTLTPVLLLMGYEPMQVVPAILLSELLTGLFAGFAHHAHGNVDFRPRSDNGKSVIENLKALGYVETARRRLPPHLRVALLIAACSIVGTVAAVFAAVSISKFALKLYIGVMVLAIGVLILCTRRKQQGSFSWRKLIGCGLIASFNKGISGGGYGPVVTGGQILSGVNSRNAVAITSLAEGLTCAVGFALYLALQKVESWWLFPFLCVGALLSVPLSAKTVKRVNPDHLKLAIGLLTVALGIFTLVKLWRG